MQFKSTGFWTEILKSKSILIAIVMLGIVNSLMNVGLLLFVNESLNDNYEIPYLPFFNDHPWMAFAILLVGSLVINLIFQRKIINFTNRLLYEFEVSFLERIKNSNLKDYEKLGKERIYTHINDIRAVASIPGLFVNSFNALVIVTCCLFYFFMISLQGGLIIIGILVLLLVMYLIRNRLIEKELNQIRDLQNDYYKYLNDALNGFKEVKVNELRKRNIYNKFLLKNRTENKNLSISSGMRFLTNELLGNYSWYIVIGLVLFLLPAMVDLQKSDLIGYVVIILYLISPVATLITLIPSIMSIKIASNRLDEFNLKLSRNKLDISKGEKDIERFESFRLEGITYSYFVDKVAREFVLGPLDLEVTRNELLFITGGNGSGKSTLMNIMLGLYKPEKGRIFINGQPVDDDFVLSNLASTVFANPFLFSENYDGFDLSGENKDLGALISQMQLESVLKKKDNYYQITSELSKGQQKRMALILALLEEQEVLVLDEWAAEQDKEFRKFFYEKLLHYWKAEGKTMIVITHDDKYYHEADRVVKLDLGKVVEEVDQKERQLNL